MSYVCYWLLAALLCGFLMYHDRVDLDFRIHTPRVEDGPFRYYRALLREVFQLLLHDCFRINCPWSWRVAKHYRVADMRSSLPLDGYPHRVLGELTRLRCDDPEQQEVIARYGYTSRTKYWMRGVAAFLLSPIVVPLAVMMELILTVYVILRFVWYVVWESAH